VSGSAEKHLPKLIQVRAGSSLVQFLSAQENPSNQQKAIAFLTEESRRLDSRVLSALAVQVSARPQGMGMGGTGSGSTQVVSMIKTLIKTLKRQGDEESTHKGFCDASIKANGHTRTSKTALVDLLKSSIDQIQAKHLTLKKDIKLLAAEVALINKDLAKEMAGRAKEKKLNEEALIAAASGQKAIVNAVKVLKEFFHGKANSTALNSSEQLRWSQRKQLRSELLQSKKRTAQMESKESSENDKPKSPSAIKSSRTFKSRSLQVQPHVRKVFEAPAISKEQQAQNNVVLGILEVIRSDFATLESETKTAEIEAHKEHQSFLTATNNTRADKEKAAHHKKKAMADGIRELSDKKENMVAAQSELDAALKTYEILKPQCVNAAVGDNIAKIQEEIATLRSTLKILTEGVVDESWNSKATYSVAHGGNR